MVHEGKTEVVEADKYYLFITFVLKSSSTIDPFPPFCHKNGLFRHVGLLFLGSALGYFYWATSLFTRQSVDHNLNL